MRLAVSHLKKSDPVLKGIIERVGAYRIEYRPPSFETLVRSIVFQQISGNVARAILGRLQDAIMHGEITPENIMRLRAPRMRKAGLSSQKAEYIRDLARKTLDGSVRFETLPDTDDAQVIETLTQVKGIGVWTAQMFLIFALRRPDVLPTGDLGVRKAMQIAYRLPDLPKPPAMEEIAKPWRPYCTAASWYMWRSLEENAGI
jgi:DNA-3-methyladenine glycosylase II